MGGGANWMRAGLSATGQARGVGADTPTPNPSTQGGGEAHSHARAISYSAYASAVALVAAFFSSSMSLEYLSSAASRSFGRW
jgi:hypothetical protein